jgi:hypothetical protein
MSGRWLITSPKHSVASPRTHSSGLIAAALADLLDSRTPSGAKANADAVDQQGCSPVIGGVRP